MNQKNHKNLKCLVCLGPQILTKWINILSNKLKKKIKGKIKNTKIKNYKHLLLKNQKMILDFLLKKMNGPQFINITDIYMQKNKNY
jgi:hypothetical protein